MIASGAAKFRSPAARRLGPFACLRRLTTRVLGAEFGDGRLLKPSRDPLRLLGETSKISSSVAGRGLEFAQIRQPGSEELLLVGKVIDRALGCLDLTLQSGKGSLGVVCRTRDLGDRAGRVIPLPVAEAAK
ncbi:hypothetical protein ACFQV2_31485 [Actinokineospora soli]|uniref:Uncharacterized protein n=1 Tax=Actinokineospora soli TaxID=1048753 RepID=A0ABW2TU78_9PSEU